MKNFGKYFIKKFLWYALTFCVALILNFLLPRLIPGNPVDSMLSGITAGMADTTKAVAIREEYYEIFGLNLPLWKQFFVYVSNVLSGDMGYSFTEYPRTVTSLIGAKLPWTLSLQIPAILCGWTIGNLLGAIAAYKKGVFDKTVFPVSLFFSSIPAFIFAMVLQYFFGVALSWFPVQGGYAGHLLPSAGWAYYMSLFRYWQLPFLALVIIAVGGQAIGMRSMSLYELNADYVLYAKLLGIRDRRITGYVFRNAVLPQVTGLALSLGTMVGGALITEIVFSYPGIGQALMRAIRSIDYPVISGITLIISVAVLIMNFLVEIIYGLLDPRIRSAQQEDS